MEQLHFPSKPEIVIGLVGAVGADFEPIKRVLIHELKKLRYHTEFIRLSDLLEEIFGIPRAPQDYTTRTKRLMDQGDELREATDQPDMLAHLAIAAIRRRRQRKHPTPVQGSKSSVLELSPKPSMDLASKPLEGHAFVLHSLKHPAEVDFLRQVYGPSFFLIAAYSKREARVQKLVRDIAQSLHDTDRSRYRGDAESLMNRDERDRDKKKYGQNVQDTFALADIFVDVSSRQQISVSLSRFIKSFFSFQFHTPSQAEYGMFHAVAAARRSADLSRQVGAAIATPEGDIVAVGCNEVPKAGGGMYWEEDPHKARDCDRGEDSSHVIKAAIMNEVYGRLREAKRVSPKYSFGNFVADLDGAAINDLLEFGRMVHAEMAALMDASRRGVSVKGCTMYVTTFPCHMCARHIIASGVQRVVYIEPYPKSKVRELYEDSVSIDGQTAKADDAVRFDPFVGVAPRQYMQLFSIPSDMGRKDRSSGKVKEWNPEESTPRFREFVSSYIFLEMRAEIHMGRRLKEARDRLEDYKRRCCKSFVEETLEGQAIDRWLSERADGLAQIGKQLFPEWMEEVIFVKERTLWRASIEQMPPGGSIRSEARGEYQGSGRRSRARRVARSGP